MLGDSDIRHEGRAVDGVADQQNAHWPRDSVLLKGRDRKSAAEAASQKLPSYETLMKEQGGYGKFQILHNMLLCMCICTSGWMIYCQSYLLLLPHFICEGIDDPSSEYDKKCKPEYFCEEQNDQFQNEFVWYPDDNHEYTLDNWMKKYNLYCASSLLISAIGMSYFSGFALGAAFLPNYSDRNGRKKIFLAAVFLQFISMGIPIVAGKGMGWYYVIIVTFFTHGLATSVRALVGFCIMCDFAPESAHSMIGSCWNVAEGLTYIWLTIYYRYISKNWVWPEVFSLGMIVVSWTLILVWMPESPKWLYKKGKFQECNVILRRMAAFNGMPEMPSVRMLLYVDPDDYNGTNKPPNSSAQSVTGPSEQSGPSENQPLTGNETQRMTVKDEILGNKIYIFNIVCMCLVWMSASFGYYLIGYDLKYIKGNKYTNGIVSSSSECVAFMTAGVLLDKVGIKKTLVLSYIIGLIGMFMLIVTPKDISQTAISFMVLGAKFGVSQAFVVSYVGNYKMFPASIVGTTMGICNIFSRVSTIFAPYVAEIDPESVGQSIFCVILAMALGASILMKPYKGPDDEEQVEDSDHVTEAVERKTNQDIIDFSKNEISNQQTAGQASGSTQNAHA